ncbi:MAG TPA: YdeI/OmpD-associated family protein, partial [Longimicrobiaceae bacterium]|nr:YdeI/OmpD-associated family protein [Longimicrobiaceae bacterium]
MGTRDPRVDAYIDRSADFAKPILTHLREVVHQACPEVEETMKWSAPFFMYRGVLGGMAAFKAHCAFNFWKGSLIGGSDGRKVDDAMGQFGRITSVADLPPDAVVGGYVREAMRLNEEGVKAPERDQRQPKPALAVPDYLDAALDANPQARATFDGFSPSHRREYVAWVTEAKSEATRARRLEQAIEWMA